MTLDIQTERGQKSLRDEQRVADWFNAKPGHWYIQTPKNAPAIVDAVLVRDYSLIGVAETKCRYSITLSRFQSAFNNEWLVTYSKIASALNLANGLCVPLFGFLYLVDDTTLLVQNLSRVTMQVRTTQTQRTINGGLAIRENAFIPMDSAKIYRGIV